MWHGMSYSAYKCKCWYSNCANITFMMYRESTRRTLQQALSNQLKCHAILDCSGDELGFSYV